MTTEDDFQRALDANPDDWQTRLVFADWLDERGDPRADGMRALGLLRRCPYQPGRRNNYWTWGDYSSLSTDSSDLPPGWFEVVFNTAPEDCRNYSEMGRWVRIDTRRDADDTAALAFAELLAANALT